MKRIGILTLVAVFGLVAGGCSEPELDNRLVYEGGGFLFNYRIGEVRYGVRVAARPPLPPGTIVEARLQNPAGGDDFVIRQIARPDQTKYVFESPALSGVQKDVPYRVEVIVLDKENGRELQRLGRELVSSLDQSSNPDRPLTLGPGYHKNPAAFSPDGELKN